MTQRQCEYQTFLESIFWKEIRTACLERDGHRCRYCNAPGRLQAHHIIYPQDWYQTTLDHLITLCVLCHEKEHGITRKPTVRRKSKNHTKPHKRLTSKVKKRHFDLVIFSSAKTELALLERRRACRKISRQQFKNQKRLLIQKYSMVTHSELYPTNGTDTQKIDWLASQHKQTA